MAHRSVVHGLNVHLFHVYCVKYNLGISHFTNQKSYLLE